MNIVQAFEIHAFKTSDNHVTVVVAKLFIHCYSLRGMKLIRKIPGYVVHVGKK